jgi:hypothetical protein
VQDEFRTVSPDGWELGAHRKAWFPAKIKHSKQQFKRTR